MAEFFVFGTPPAGAVKAADFEILTITDTAAALSAKTSVAAANAAAGGCAGVTFMVEAQPVRMTFNSETPDATTGFGLDAEDVVTIWGAGLVNGVKLIREGGTNATAQTVAYTLA